MHYFFKKTDGRIEDIETEIFQWLKDMLGQSFMMVEMNAKGQIIEVNDEFTRIFKYTSAELNLKDYWILNSGYHSAAFKKEVTATLRNGRKWSGELCQRAKNGELIWLKSTMIPLINGEYIVISVDITEKKVVDKWKYMAWHHDLTNLPNRRMFNFTVESYISKAKYKDKKIAILFLDINKFKKINDQYGHIVGDHFLIEVGNRLTSIPKLKENVYHISGDEFIIIIEDVVNLEEQIQSILNLFNHLFIIENHQFYASASIGASIYPDHSNDIQTIIKYANDAMYVAKRERDEQKLFIIHHFE